MLLYIERPFKHFYKEEQTVEQNQYIKIVSEYGNTIFRIAFSYCKNKGDAEDIVQNVFLKLLQSKQEFQDETHMKKWLIRVAVNESKNLCTSFWKKRIFPLDDFDQDQSYQFPSQECSDLYFAVMKLPEKYRLVIHLYYYEDYSVREISEILQRKEATIQTQLMRARAKLKTYLKEDWNNEQQKIVQGNI